MRRTSICGATETILCHKNVAKNILPELIKKLIENGCIVKGDNKLKNKFKIHISKKRRLVYRILRRYRIH